jgi:hypothetical protein
MADLDINKYLGKEGQGSVSKGGVTVSRGLPSEMRNSMPEPSTPMDARSRSPGPIKTATDHHWK